MGIRRDAGGTVVRMRSVVRMGWQDSGDRSIDLSPAAFACEFGLDSGGCRKSPYPTVQIVADRAWYVVNMAGFHLANLSVCVDRFISGAKCAAQRTVEALLGGREWKEFPEVRN